ncbi:MAG: tRNA uridine-5-carboxymethylaminomethyl(34) synthesis GTPase MnmE [Pseudomonadota bacterium]
MTAGDTIFAPATPAGRGGIAVVRISGPEAPSVLAELGGALPPPRQAAVRRLRDAGGGLLDEALVLRFEAGASFTGEAMAELHLHGGPAVVGAVLDALSARPGLRLADPGEFTLRAFQAGRMDLTEVEALGDLLAAETEAQRQQAARLVEGALANKIEAWRAGLLRAVALVEVTIDWADEDVPEDVGPEVGTLLTEVSTGIAAELALSDGAARLRTGYEVALVGAPNAGKSSLINLLAGREAAIVSEVPGTTRDVLEVRYDLQGLPVTFLDTAGIRASSDRIEAEGIRRAEARAQDADLRVLLDAPDAPLGALRGLAQDGDVLVAAKADLCEGDGMPVSAATGDGVERLLERVHTALRARPTEGLVAHRRQRLALEAVRDAATVAREGLDHRGPELISEDIRQGLRALARLTGAVGTEEILGEIFGRFCLGK